MNNFKISAEKLLLASFFLFWSFFLKILLLLPLSPMTCKDIHIHHRKNLLNNSHFWEAKLILQKERVSSRIRRRFLSRSLLLSLCSNWQIFDCARIRGKKLSQKDFVQEQKLRSIKVCQLSHHHAASWVYVLARFPTFTYYEEFWFWLAIKSRERIQDEVELKRGE